MSLKTTQKRYSDFRAQSEGGVETFLAQIYPETAEMEEILHQIDDLKKCVASFRPLDAAQLKNLEDAFETEYTYDSNRIEGNTLTLQETYLVIAKGMTVGGKPLKDHVEASNHRDAIVYVKEIAANQVPLSERVLLDIHNIILGGIDHHNAGRYRSVPVRIAGSRHIPPNAMKVPTLMEQLFVDYESSKDALHPVLLAAEMHVRLVTIHPFIDGNGRTARLLQNLILLRHGYVIANIRADERLSYYEALESASVQGKMEPFHRLVAMREKRDIIHYLAMLEPDIENGKGGYFLELIESILARCELSYIKP